MTDFGKQIEAHVERYKRRLRVVAKESVQETVKIAQRPVGDGGRMRVDTGFLRASIAANIGGMPSGESKGDGEAATYTGNAVSATLLQWDLKDTLYVGWTASYSRAREYKDGFMRGATELWSTTVDEVAMKVRRSL